VSDRLFSLLIFLHIGIPLALLAAMWVHLQRLSRPASNPPRALAIGSIATIALLALARPVTSDAPADLALAPSQLSLDWFYLGFHAFADALSPVALWIAVGGATLLLLALPYVSRRARTPRPAAAVVDPANCNGCGRCFADCPYLAVTMQPRTDGRPLPRQAVVDPDLCAACGICAGACPSSTPFRSAADLVTGIDLPQFPIDALRAQLERELQRIAAGTLDDAGDGVPRVVVFGCAPEKSGPGPDLQTENPGPGPDFRALADAHTATLPLVCAAQLPPSFIEYALRAGADAVLVAGCRDGDCAFRLGNRWTEERIAGERAPHLRAHVARERVGIAWVGRGNDRTLVRALESLRKSVVAARALHRAPPPRRLRAETMGRTSQ
jgi:coenzyme F420-reducing hydrogenase delta subunit/ferredoxin